MNNPAVTPLAQLKSEITLLKGRERSLRQLAQSPRCSNRSEAEQQLLVVREQIDATYARMRPLEEHGSRAAYPHRTA